MTTATAKAPQSLKETQKIAARFRVQQTPSHPPLPEKVIKIIKHIDRGCSLAEICQREQISVEQGKAVVKKLAAQGILQPLPKTTKTRRQTQAMPVASEQRWLETLKGLPVFGSKHFDALEEAFFASEVEQQLEEDLPLPRLTDRLRGLLGSLRRKRD